MSDQIGQLKKTAVTYLAENRKLKFSFTSYSRNYIELSYFLVNHVLAIYRMNFLENVIMTLLKESIANAVKANLKRAFFSAHDVDINDPGQYQSMIDRFRTEAVSKLDTYIPRMNEMNLKVQIFLEVRDDFFLISVRNNTGMTPQELERVSARVKKAAELSDMGEAFAEFSDETEGAGLGLFLSIMLLKTTGIGSDNFKISSDGQETRVDLRIPRNLAMASSVELIQNKIVNEIDTIPTFPQNIQKVIALCDSANSDMNQVAHEIEKDPSLATGILKLVNSAGFARNSRISSIQHAATILGTKAVRNMAVAQSSRAIMNEHYKVFETFWDHAFRAGFYCKAIAEKTGNAKIADSAFVGGLLHDLGKIVLYSIDESTIKAINGMIVDRNRASTAVLEEISLGISHSDVGAKLAEKWNFTPDVVQMIRLHHAPFAAEPDYLPAVSIVHLGDAMINVESKKGSYVHFDLTALETLGIHTQPELVRLHEEIRSAFEANQAREKMIAG